MENQNEKRTELGELGEFGLIERITKDLPKAVSSTVLGVGDDAAIIAQSNEMESLLSTDMLVEGVHFDLSFMPLKHLGYKAVVVNLSDIYAMGGVPEQITVSLAISNRFSVEAIEAIYEGIKQACSFYNVDLVGGDTTSSLKGLIISVTAVGKVAKGKALKRSGAKVGDIVCVTGDLGGAYIGFQILNREKQVYLSNPGTQPQLEDHEYVVGRQLKPEARKDIIEAFAKGELQPTSMIDVSDGLSSELLHICKASKVGCQIYEANVPVHPETYNQAIEFNIDPITCALSGGEDYELLFTVAVKDEAKIEGLDVKVIGTIVEEEKGCKIVTRANHIHDLTAQGWNALS